MRIYSQYNNITDKKLPQHFKKAPQHYHNNNVVVGIFLPQHQFFFQKQEHCE